MKVAVLTTSYPRFAGDAAGRFVADAAERVAARGVEVSVVSPRDFNHFGIAYGAGIAGNLRRAPWKAAFVPAMLAAFLRAARPVVRDADLVHAHWLPSGLVARALRRPYVVQVWGTDVVLAARARSVFRPVLCDAAAVICASTALAEAVEPLGARNVHVIPPGVVIPEAVPEPVEPPEILYAGRLSAEKGVLELVEAARGMRLVVAGDGPLRSRVPGALGWVPHRELLDLYERAAIVACPSRREGFGVVCAEAMAHGRAVVATPVGGMRDLVTDGETGLVVPPGDIGALRRALERLLAEGELRLRLGAAARERARERLDWDRVTDATLAVYEATIDSR